jgi:TetR/AcrR family transcriptional regulator, copper-responsive repressor
MRNSTQIKARRGRPPEYDRDAALGAIVETFRRQGYASTSLDDLAIATGMKRPSLYAAFGNKKAMYLAALEHFRHTMAAMVDTATEPSKALPEAATALFDAAIAFYCAGAAPGCLVLCTATAEAAADADIRAALADVLVGIELQIRRLIDRAVSAGTPIVDPAALSQLLSAVLVSIAVQARAGVAEAQLRSFARASVTAALGSASPGRSRRIRT